jgi:hypothetical protein
MRLALALALLVVITAGCASETSAPAPVWQRFEALGSRLDGVTRLSYALASDMGMLRRAVGRGEKARIAQLADRTRRDAGKLTSQAAHAAARLRPLVRSIHGRGSQATYLEDQLRILKMQGMEGRSVEAIAVLLRQDPLLMSPASVARLRTLERRANRTARRAVLAARGAAALRRARPSAFRYVPVREASSAPGPQN